MIDFYIPLSFTSSVVGGFAGTMLTQKNSGDRGFEVVIAVLPAWVVEIAVFYTRPGIWLAILFIGIAAFLCAFFILKNPPKKAAKFAGWYLGAKAAFYGLMTLFFG